MTTQSTSYKASKGWQRAVIAGAAGVITWSLFAGVLSLADDAPMAIAGVGSVNALAHNRHADVRTVVAAAPVGAAQTAVR